MRRIDGKNGWMKVPCNWSRTGWAWAKGDDSCMAECTCDPCKPPRESLDEPETSNTSDRHGLI